MERCWDIFLEMESILEKSKHLSIWVPSHTEWQVTQQTNRPREGGKRFDVEVEMFFNRFSGNHQPGKQPLLLISINLKALKPAIQWPKRMVLSYVFHQLSYQHLWVWMRFVLELSLVNGCSYGITVSITVPVKNLCSLLLVVELSVVFFKCQVERM